MSVGLRPDAELLFTDFAEVIAERFLKDPRDIKDIGMLGVKLTDLLNLLPNDLYNRVMEVLEKNDVTTNILRALERLCNNKLDFKDFDENGLNRRVRDYLYGYTVLDQTQQGLGENGKDPGSLDILIKENGLNTAIYEGLNHRNTKYLFDHIDKTVGRYNPSGCRSIYIGEFYRAKRFSMAWNNTVKSLQEKYTGTEVDTGRNGIWLFKIREERIDIWVFGVDMVLD